MLARLQNPFALLGRLFLAVLFITSGFGKLTGFQGTVGYIAAHGLPAPALAAVIAIAVELGGGLALVVGFKTRWAALAMAIFTLAAAVVFHAFWTAPPAQAMNTTIHFWKNVSITGGLLMVVAFGAGAFSIDARGGPVAAPQRALA